MMFSANIKRMFFMPSLLIVFLVVLLVLLLSPKNITAQNNLFYSPLPLTNPNSVIAQSMDIVQYSPSSRGKHSSIPAFQNSNYRCHGPYPARRQGKISKGRYG